MIRSAVTATVAAWLGFGVPALARAGEDTASLETREIRQLLDLTGASKLAAQMGSIVATQMLAAMKQANPSIPDKAGQVVSEVVAKYLGDPAAVNPLLEQMIPVYEKYFSEADVRQLLVFYRSPVGQKLVASMPAVLNDSTQISQQWALSIMPGMQQELLKRLKEEHLIE